MEGFIKIHGGEEVAYTQKVLGGYVENVLSKITR